MSADPNSPQVLAGLLTEQEAALLAAHLNDSGIRAEVVGAIGTAAWPEVPDNVQVLVRRADLARAQEELARYRQGA